MASENNTPPAAWKVDDVITWAIESRLTTEVLSSLTSNQVDGPTLVTLRRSELHSELGIASLPARRFLWELIKSLKSEQVTHDYSAAIGVHEQEIQTFSAGLDSVTKIQGPDAASGDSSGSAANDASSIAVAEELAKDVRTQRQAIEDHMMSFRLQRILNHGQDICKDAELAHEEQDRLDGLLAQIESDREYAESLARGRERVEVRRRKHRQETAKSRERASDRWQQSNAQEKAAEPNIRSPPKSRIESIFGFCLPVQTDSGNKERINEAFEKGMIKPLSNLKVASDEGSSGSSSSSSVGDDDEDGRKLIAVPRDIFNLPFVEQCNVCYEENLKGYNLACGHIHCVQCMRKLFRATLRDNTLLPLVCCELPIDMNIAKDLLKPDESSLILKRVAEKEAKNKMYCPSCSSFINLDLVDASGGSTLFCDCGTWVCITCKTKSHTGFTCQQNQAIQSGSDDMMLELSREQGWKQCPKCSIMIEFRSGCNHMTCSNCAHEFCYRCLRDWAVKEARCSSGTCELWEEDRLVEASEARVQQQEAAHGRMPEPIRRARLFDAMEGLRANEVCVHQWTRRQGYQGDCPNCSFTMWAYGMHCRSQCGSTVCYTCAHHRIPNRGWR